MKMPEMSSEELRGYLQEITYFTQTRGAGRPTAVYNAIKAVGIAFIFYFAVMFCLWLVGEFNRPQPRPLAAHQQIQRTGTRHAQPSRR